jgi:tellurite resistance protein TehA-like permease
MTRALGQARFKSYAFNQPSRLGYVGLVLIQFNYRPKLGKKLGLKVFFINFILEFFLLVCWFIFKLVKLTESCHNNLNII